MSLLPKEINHRGLFCFGVLYYLIVPIFIHESNIFDDLPGINPWKDDVRFTNATLQLYAILVLLLLVSFLIGSFIGAKYINIHYATSKRLGNTSSKIIFFILSIFVLGFIYKVRGLAFKGGYHGEDDASQNVAGILSTSNLLLFYIHFVLDQPKKIKNLILILFLINSFFLLGLGGRMYIIIPAVAYYMRAYNNAAKNGKSLLPYTIIPLVAALVAAIIGALRIGENINLLGYFIFAEPIFTSYSAFTFITRHHVELVSVPYNFIVSFLNIIPSLFWPGKSEQMGVLLSGWEKNYESPLGALSIFVSVFADFGIILGSLFMTCVGALFGHLYRAYKSGNINKDVYYCFCCVLPFSFFRDPIAIPIKIFILSYLILPFIMHMVRLLLKKKTAY